MTHQLRIAHDAILVGIGTVLCDNPQLSARHLPPALTEYCNPRPVVLDPKLRIPLDARLLVGPNADSCLLMPWIVVGPGACVEKCRAVEQMGATVICIKDVDAEGRPKLHAVVAELERRGIRRLMVEGGAHIISAFLAEQQLVHTLVITIAPVFVGTAEGVPVTTTHGNNIMRHVSPLVYEQFGCDVVL
ncbi:hypothetical protein GGI21_002657, partial [Coemansia aciculifera]